MLGFKISRIVTVALMKIRAYWLKACHDKFTWCFYKTKLIFHSPCKRTKNLKYTYILFTGSKVRTRKYFSFERVPRPRKNIFLPHKTTKEPFFTTGLIFKRTTVKMSLQYHYIVICKKKPDEKLSHLYFRALLLHWRVWWCNSKRKMSWMWITNWWNTASSSFWQCFSSRNGWCKICRVVWYS